MVSSSLGGIMLADDASTCVGEARRLLDARAGGGAHVQADLAGDPRREEVVAERGEQAERRRPEQEERAADQLAAGEQHAEQHDVEGARTRSKRRRICAAPAAASCGAGRARRPGARISSITSVGTSVRDRM